MFSIQNNNSTFNIPDIPKTTSPKKLNHSFNFNKATSNARKFKKSLNNSANFSDRPLPVTPLAQLTSLSSKNSEFNTLQSQFKSNSVAIASPSLYPHPTNPQQINILSNSINSMNLLGGLASHNSHNNKNKLTKIDLTSIKRTKNNSHKFTANFKNIFGQSQHQDGRAKQPMLRETAMTNMSLNEYQNKIQAAQAKSAKILPISVNSIRSQIASSDSGNNSQSLSSQTCSHDNSGCSESSHYYEFLKDGSECGENQMQNLNIYDNVQKPRMFKNYSEKVSNFRIF